VYGSSGSFKSFHALSWACHVSLGIEWNNCKVNKQPVLYIAGEGGIGVPRRIRALEKHYNDGEKIENLYRLDFPIAMGDVNQVNQLALTIGFYAQNLGVKFGLVIIDTLA
ncbi:AAA family ATPase, partial [Vibrio sp. 10N.261.45.A4]|uniref:AAA family ATPase n=1 Tax=Vibrio sp. 10N.261.45.A4 TaxID=3229655 RepID=UPI00354D073B